MWIHNLIFNNEKIENWYDNRRSSGKNYEFKDSINISDISQNNTDLLQINYWPQDTRMWLQNTSIVATYQETTTENTKKSHFWNKLYLSVLDNFGGTNIPFSNVYHNVSYANILKEPSNDIYKYKEIGKTKSSENQNYNVDCLKKQKQFKYQNKLLSNSKNFDKTTAEGNKDSTELNDFEFLLPFDFEDMTNSYSNVTTIYYKNLYIFLYFVISLILLCTCNILFLNI